MSPPVAPLSHGRAIAIIVAVWAGWLGVLAGLGWLGQGVGLAVWPMGEDRNWTALLQLPTIDATVRGFWAIDHRNPLSPWWYVAFKPLILGWPCGLFMLRNWVGLALAAATYALIASWLGAKARSLAVTIGSLIGICTFNAFFDQIYWNFQAALVCSILCVVCYLKHLRRPASGQWLAASLVLWIVAIATYTIQTGAVLAIAFAGLLAGWSGAAGCPAGRLARSVWAACAATWPFGLLLVVFVMIWQTTSVPSSDFVGTPGIGRLLESLRMGLWHEDNTLMGLILAGSPHRRAFLAVAALAFLAVALCLGRLGRPPLPRRALIGLAILAGCLAVPTLAIETFGSQWPPGSRWRMLYQFSSPVFYIAFLGIAATLLPERIGRWFWAVGGAACFALAALGSLAHNERQMLLAHNERGLRDAILGDAALRADPATGGLHYLFFLDEGTRWFASDRLSPAYAKSWFPHADITFRLVPAPLYEALQPAPPVVFDDAGVENATPEGGLLPYSRLRIVVARQGIFTIVDQLQESDLTGFRAIWRRSRPLSLAPCAASGGDAARACR